MITEPSQKESGSTLVLALIIVGISFVVVGSYVGLALNRNKVAMHSMAWNQAMAVAEAGVEEGLAQIQYSITPTNGWSGAGGVYSLARNSPFGGTNSHFAVNFTSADPPVITSTGYVRAPLLSGYIKRVVRVTTVKGTNQFPYGIRAKGTITISGSSILDSFDSSDTNYSINGMYTPLRHKDNIYVASQSGASKAVQVGTGKIFGYVETSAGTVTVGSSGVVGDNNYASNSLNAGTIQMSPVYHALTNYNKDVVDVSLPSGILTNALSPPLPGTHWVNGTNYTYALGNGTYNNLASLTIPGGGSMVVTGNATLYVPGSFTLSGSGFVYLAPGSTFSLYVGTTNVSGNDSITISGGGVANGTGVASSFAVFGLPSVKTATYSGSAAFIGTSDAPEASTTLSGSAMGVG
ncbi:MAG TPA: hypothetical protein VG146_16320 [Verrucomicrobiae bacterium]|nr:hypothetical protein [Verrucomicrobiae bacterium]